MLLCPCGQLLETRRLYHPWLLLWLLSLPNPPPFTILLSIWFLSQTSASSCVAMWHSAEGHSVDVCVRTAQHKRAPAGNLITETSATPQGCPTGFKRTTGRADTVPALKQTWVPLKTLQTTAPSRLPG